MLKEMKNHKNHTVDGQNPAPPRMMIIPLFMSSIHPRWCRLAQIVVHVAGVRCLGEKQLHGLYTYVARLV